MWSPQVPRGRRRSRPRPSILQFLQPRLDLQHRPKAPVRRDTPFTAFYLGPAPIVLGVVLVGAGVAGMLARLNRA